MTQVNCSANWCVYCDSDEVCVAPIVRLKGSLRQPKPLCESATEGLRQRSAGMEKTIVAQDCRELCSPKVPVTFAPEASTLLYDKYDKVDFDDGTRSWRTRIYQTKMHNFVVRSQTETPDPEFTHDSYHIWRRRTAVAELVSHLEHVTEEGREFLRYTKIMEI